MARTKKTKTVAKSLETLNDVLAMPDTEAGLSMSMFLNEAHMAEAIAADVKQNEIDAAWAEHTAEDTLKAQEAPTADQIWDGRYIEVNGRRYTLDGKEIYFLNRAEIEECAARFVKKIFSSREEIEKCARDVRERAIKAKRDRNIQQAIADGRIMSALSDGKGHNLQDLQMLAQKKVA